MKGIQRIMPRRPECFIRCILNIRCYIDQRQVNAYNRAKQLDGTERDGYWWLAFDWRNYRISGAIGNRPNRGEDDEIRGKADYFPLREGSPVATGPECNLRDELIYFLDPTDANDPLLLNIAFHRPYEEISVSGSPAALPEVFTHP